MQKQNPSIAAVRGFILYMLATLIIITLILTPTYVVRFELFNQSTNLLMVWMLFAWVVTLVHLTLRKEWREFLASLAGLDRKILTLSGLFFAAGVVSVFVGGVTIEKIGQFIVLFLQPASAFVIARYAFQKNPNKKPLLIVACYILVAVMGVLAIVQYLTLFGLPLLFQGNMVEPRRAVSVFIHPNFYALFAAPLLSFLIPNVVGRIKNWKLSGKYSLGDVGEIGNLELISCWVIGVIGLLLSMSRAGWFGLAIAVIFYIFASKDKKLLKAASVAAICIGLVIFSLAPLRARIVKPFQGEKSALSRTTLWKAGWTAIAESPLTGLGLTGFSQNWPRLNPDQSLDHHNFPHNIFLNLWVETGLLGLIGFLGIVGLIIRRGLGAHASASEFTSRQMILPVALFLITLLAQGLLDNPYFKNDLAMVFWIILSLIV